MSRMSDLDLMVRDGCKTALDFIRRGYDARTARAMAEFVSGCPWEIRDDSAGNHDSLRSVLEAIEATPVVPTSESVWGFGKLRELRRDPCLCPDCEEPGEYYTVYETPRPGLLRVRELPEGA
jgi:hypothetical protein